MGLLKGSVTVRRYVVRGKVPTDRGKLVKGVRAHVFMPIDPASDVEKSFGWAGGEDPELLDLESDSLFVGGAMLLSLRIDTLTPPAAVVKRLVAEKLRELGRKPGRRDKQEAKDAVKKSLRKRAFPSTRAYEVVWSLDEGRVFFFTHGKGPGELLVDLFAKSFGLELVPSGPGVVAGPGLPKNLSPTVELSLGFPGLPGRPIAGEDGEGDDQEDDEDGLDKDLIHA
jgi:DNA recombination-dependent growth factor C